MSIPARLLRQPLLVQKTSTTATDDYGNTVVAAEGLPVQVRGLLDFQQSTEVINDRDTVTTQWLAFVPADTDIDALDYVIFNGSTFRVTGQPQQVWNPRRGSVSHIEVRLTEVQ